MALPPSRVAASGGEVGMTNVWGLLGEVTRDETTEM